MKRGDLHSYLRPSTPEVRRTVVVLSGEGVNRSARSWLLGIELRDHDPDDLLAVSRRRRPIRLPGDLEPRLYRAWMVKCVGRLDATTLARVDGVVRSALDL